MPRWDFYCPVCFQTVEKSFPNLEATEHATCDDCKVPVQRLPAPGSFIIKGYSYKNGYGKK